MVMNGLTECADMSSGAGSARQQLRRRERRLLGVVLRLDAMPAAFLADMLAQKLMDSGIENADVKQIPLHFDELSNPSGRDAVVRRFDFDAAVQMHDAFTVLVVTERFDRQRKQEWFFFGEHRCDLTLCRTVNARVGP